MNLSAIPNSRWYGRLLRMPLKALPAGMTLPILQGALRGKRWIVGSGSHGYWLGSYEYRKREVFERTVSPGMVVFDVGAHVGFYTLLASVLVGPRGQVVAFEPVQRNLGYLYRHLSLNKISNASVIEAAVSDVDGYAQFAVEADSSMGHLGQNGGQRVRTVVLDALAEDGRLPMPDCLKIDVEGAEVAVLRGALGILRARGPVLFLSTHSPVIHERCRTLLEACRYHFLPIGADTSGEVLASRSL